jgi:predicted transcriptional regulator of viral defense system
VSSTHGKRVLRNRIDKMRNLQVLDEIVAQQGSGVITPALVQSWTGQSSQATGNMLRRLSDSGLLDRVARGRYVVRPIGLLNTSAASEDITLAVGAAFLGHTHRIAYRSALDHHGLLLHPARTVQVATTNRVKFSEISGRPLQAVLENPETVLIGADKVSYSCVSDVERSLIDAASRPDLIGGITVLAQALSLADVDSTKLLSYAQSLEANAAIRRLGSLADQLAIDGLAGALEPLMPPRSDIDLDNSAVSNDRAFRDRRWFVRWHQPVEEIASNISH